MLARKSANSLDNAFKSSLRTIERFDRVPIAKTRSIEFSTVVRDSGLLRIGGRILLIDHVDDMRETHTDIAMARCIYVPLTKV